MAVVEAEVVVRNKLGVHSRPAAQVCRIACEFHSDITLRTPRSVMVGSQAVGSASGEFDEANAKAIMEILAAALAAGSRVVIHAEGDDAAEAVAALTELFEAQFGEELHDGPWTQAGGAVRGG